MKTIKDQLVEDLHTWGTRYDWQRNAWSLTNGSYNPVTWSRRYPTLYAPLDDKFDAFCKKVFGDTEPTAFLRKFVQEASTLENRKAWLRQRLDAAVDAGMGSGDPWATAVYHLNPGTIGIDVHLEFYHGNRILLSAEFHDYVQKDFDDLYMARFCDHDFVDNGSRMCLHRSKCTKCGHTIEVDSSD